MSLTTFTPTAGGIWVPAPRTVVAGQKMYASEMLSVMQDEANRSEYLQARRTVAPSASTGVVPAALGAGHNYTGDTSTHEDSVVQKTLACAIGDKINFAIVCAALVNTSTSSWGDLWARITQNTTDTDVAGSDQRVLGDSSIHRVYLPGQFTATVTAPIIKLCIKNSDSSVTTAIWGGWQIMVW